MSKERVDYLIKANIRDSSKRGPVHAPTWSTIGEANKDADGNIALRFHFFPARQDIEIRLIR